MNSDSPFDIPVKLPRYVGFYLEYDAFRKGFLQKCFTIYSLLALFSSILLFLFGAYKSIEDVEEFARFTVSGFASCDATLYVFTYCVWSEKFKLMMDEFMDNLRTDDSTNPRDLVKLTKFTKKFMTFFEFVILSIACIDILPSFFDLIFNGNRQFPYNISHFWNLTESPFYEFVYITIVWVAVIANSSILFYGTICLIYSVLIVMSLKNIRKSLMQMKHKKFDPNKFKKIVQRHVRAHEYFEKFSNLYGPGLIVKFIMVGTSLCVHGFVLLEVENDDFWKILQAILNFFIVNAGVLTILTIGTMISNESARIDKAIYDIYLDVPRTFHVDLLIIMIRSQKHFVFKAWVFKASFDTLASIVNAAYSYFTILRTLK